MEFDISSVVGNTCMVHLLYGGCLYLRESIRGFAVSVNVEQGLGG